MDYTNEFGVVFFNAMLNASEQFKFYLDGAYTKSEGGFTDIGVLEAPAGSAVNQDLDYSLTNGYSDLDFSLFELTYGMSFLVDPGTRLYTSVTTMDLTDDQPYVYGIRTEASPSTAPDDGRFLDHHPTPPDSLERGAQQRSPLSFRREAADGRILALWEDRAGSPGARGSGGAGRRRRGPRSRIRPCRCRRR